VSRFSFPLPEGQQFTNAGRPVITVSSDGTRIAYVANRRLYLRSMSETRPREIQGSEDPDGITTPSFSPDGQQIVFVSVADRALKRISVNGGVPFTICPLPQSSFGTSWGPDGILFGQRPGNIFRVSPNGGNPQLLFKAPDGELAYGPQMLPGGDAMLLTLGRTANTAASPDLIENPRVDLYSLTSGERTTLIDRGADARYVPTGHIVYADGAALVAVGFDLKRRQVIGDSVPVVEGVRRGVASPAAQFGVSTTGMLAYVPGSALTGRALSFLDRQGGSEPLKLANGTYSTPRLSPDGKQLAVEISDSRSINIWIYDVAGRASIRQLTLEGQSRYPVWSADGERVTFASNRQGEDAIWWQRADGSGVAERLTQPMKGIEQAPTSWHPREPTLLYLARQGATDSALWTYSLTDKHAKPFPGLEGQQVVSAQFSPDGRWIAYHTTQPGPRAARLAMFVQPYPSTGAVYPVAASGSQPLWSPDGSELFFARASTLFATRITTQSGFATSVAEAVKTSFWIPTQWRNFDIAPDGKRFLAVVPAPGSEAGEFATGQIDVVLNWHEELKRLVPTQ
jgi:Tol biopolymer transport system component